MAVAAHSGLAPHRRRPRRRRAQLPAGTYSDDTQLRLATSRSLRDGRLDVDAWARVELPTFTSYALGGGKATKNGAAAMTQPSKHWAEGDRAWSNAGGNGVLMRIAPLAYASLGSDLPTELLLIDVTRNGVVTHGHPRALLPACVHAVMLARSLRTGDLPDIDGVHQLLDELRGLHWLASAPRTRSGICRMASSERELVRGCVVTDGERDA